MTEKRVLLILGSGLYDMYGAELSKPISLETRFGSAQVNEIFLKGTHNHTDSGIFVMMRHGPKHKIPPHLINYRANISAAKQLNVDFIIATSSVGSLKRQIRIGSYVVLNQFIDFTKSRASSIYYDRPENFAHTDMTDPFSKKVRASLIHSLKENKTVTFRERGTYICTEGPRFETPAEIKMYGKLGGDIVGMTGVPEVVIANELGIPYGNLAFVTNMAAGLQSKVSVEEVNREMKKQSSGTKSILEGAIKELRRA